MLEFYASFILEMCCCPTHEHIYVKEYGVRKVDIGKKLSHKETDDLPALRLFLRTFLNASFLFLLSLWLPAGTLVAF